MSRLGLQNNFMKKYRILEWDTNFFGFKVALITPPSLKTAQLDAILLNMRQDGVKLAYWASGSNCMTDIEANELGCYLVDVKTTLVVGLLNKKISDFRGTANVEPYNRTMSKSDIVAIAIQSGEFSRFVIDPNITKQKFIDLYTIWINRSLKKEIADEVLVIREHEDIVGVVTLGAKDGRGNIGLIAVDRRFRGRGYGETLVRASQRYFIKNGYAYEQVATQQANVVACNLYKKCGFSVESVKYYYHFWL